MGTNAELYDTDFYAWCLTTAALIRQGKWHDIDPESVAEEMESLGRSQKRELESRLEVLMMHLLKWCYQPERREDSHSWYDTILEQRSQLTRLLRTTPVYVPRSLPSSPKGMRMPVGVLSERRGSLPLSSPRPAHGRLTRCAMQSSGQKPRPYRRIRRRQGSC